MALSPPSECGVGPGGGGRRSQRSGSTVLAQVGTTLSAEALVLQMESISTTNGTECLHNNNNNIIGVAKKRGVTISKIIGFFCVHRERLLERFHLLEAGGKWPII